MAKTQVINYYLQPTRNCLAKAPIIRRFSLNAFPEKTSSIPIDTFVRESVEHNASSPKITKSDIINFRTYLLAKRMDLKVTSEEIKKLFSYEGAEFEEKAFEFLTTKMKIPKDLIPTFYPRPEQYPIAESKMLYDWTNNAIWVNPTYKFKDKSEYLGSLRHELQHFMQNMDVYRHESLFDEVLKFQCDMSVRAYSKIIVANAEMYSLSELKNFGIDDNYIKLYERLKKALKNKNTAEYKEVMQDIEQNMVNELKPQFEAFRKTIVDRMGIIEADSPEGKRAKKYFECTKNEYMRQDNTIDYGKFFMDCRELEAMTADDVLQFSIRNLSGKKQCFLEWVKIEGEQTQKQLESNNKIMADLNNQKKEIDRQGIPFKELISFLYD